MRTLVFFVALLGAALPAPAQDLPPRLSLDEAVRIARSSNPLFRQAGNDVDLALAVERQRLGAMLPNVNASLGFSGSHARSLTGSGNFGEVIVNPTFVETTSSSASQGVGLTVTLFDGAANLNRLREARARTRAAAAGVDSRSGELRAAVSQRFYAVLQAERALRVEEQLLRSASAQLEMTQRRFEIASARREDVLGAEATVLGLELQVEQAHGRIRKERLQLLREMGIGRESDFVLVDEVPIVFDPSGLDAATLVAAALSSSPRMLEQEAALVAAERSASAAKGLRLPRIAASAGFNRSVGQRDYGAWFDLNPPNRALSFSLATSVPLFSGFQTTATVAQAEATRMNARERLRSERLALETEIRSILIDLGGAFRAVELADRSLALSQERLELTEERYRTGGTTTFVELQNATDGAARAERQAIDARFAFVHALVALEARLGSEVRP